MYFFLSFQLTYYNNLSLSFYYHYYYRISDDSIYSLSFIIFVWKVWSRKKSYRFLMPILVLKGTKEGVYIFADWQLQIKKGTFFKNQWIYNYIFTYNENIVV